MLTNLIQREGARNHPAKEMVGVIDGFDPATHTAKVKFLTEVDADGNPRISGWLAIRCASGGAGGSLVIGPSIGDQCTVSPLEGDAESGIITGFLHNDDAKAPVVQSGEAMLSIGGGSVHIDKNGVTTITGKGGSSTVHAADGSVTHTDSSGGVIKQSGGKVYLGSGSASIGVKLADGSNSTTIFGV